MKILLLDDDEGRYRAFRRLFTPPHRLEWVRQASQAVAALQAVQYDVVFLDHDLDPSFGSDSSFRHAGCGRDVVDWVLANRDHAGVACVQTWLVHSLAGEPAARMVLALRAAGFRCCDARWSWFDPAEQEVLHWAGLIDFTEGGDDDL